MTATTTRTEITAIDGSVVAALLELDDAGHQPRLLTDTDGGNPLRCCLRLSRPGEDVALVSYAPLRRWAQDRGVDAGPYDETGPVFIHTEPCGGRLDGGYPAELRGSQRLLRAYSADGRILRGVQVQPDDDVEHVLDDLLADPQVSVVHGRAVEFGCFTFEAHRRSA
jgi:Protein of unknown function (DUF1203)